MVPRIATKYFGELDWPDDEVLTLPQGLPGFAGERQFARIEPEKYRPLVFLQSVATPALCFLAAPIKSIDPGYELDVHAEELRTINSVAAVDVLAILTVLDGKPATANLLAPLVVDRMTKLGAQAIRRDRRYSCRHPLEGTPCGERLAQCR